MVSMDAPPVIAVEVLESLPPTGDGPLRVQSFDIADEERAEVDPGWDGFSADPVGVVWLTEFFNVPVEASLSEETIELVIEDVTERVG
jgi:hypothetical protein